MSTNPVIPSMLPKISFLEVQVEACLYLVAGGWDGANITTAKKVWSSLLISMR